MAEESLYPEFLELAEGRQPDFDTSNETGDFEDLEVAPYKHEEIKVLLTFLTQCVRIYKWNITFCQTSETKQQCVEELIDKNLMEAVRLECANTKMIFNVPRFPSSTSGFIKTDKVIGEEKMGDGAEQSTAYDNEDNLEYPKEIVLKSDERSLENKQEIIVSDKMCFTREDLKMWKEQAAY